MTQDSLDFGKIDGERALVKRLTQHGVDCTELFLGARDETARIERLRGAILAAQLERVVYGPNAAGKTATYAQVFENFFGEPLQNKGKANVQTAF